MRLLGDINCQSRLLLTFVSIFAACLELSGCSALIAPVLPTILLSSSQTPSSYGHAVTFTSTIPEGQGGIVTFFDNGNPIGSGLVQGRIANLTTTSLSLGTHSIVASWPGEGNFKAASSEALSQIVKTAVPDVNWNAPLTMAYGNPLSSSQLEAYSSVKGTFAYSPTAGTILGIGPNTLSVTFTPEDTVDYISVTLSVQLNVVPPYISLSEPSTLVMEGTSVQLTVTLNGPNEPVEWAVNGNIGGAPNIGTISPNGTYTAPNIPNMTVTVSAFLQADPADQQSVQITIIGPQTIPGGIGFAFTLPTSAATSAGVYDASGNLVRTLWSNRPYLTGSQSESWDGNNDSGNPVSAGSYQIRVLYNNVTYTWGVIGNTSASWTSANSWDMQNSLPVDMANANGIAYTANQYTEVAPNASSFSLSTPQAPTGLFSAKYCYEYHFIAADGNLVYLANDGNASNGAVAFIAAFDPQASQFYSFPSGETYDNNTPYANASCIGTYPTSVIDYQTPTSQGQTGPGRQNIPSGIAVQTNGNLLAVSHGAYDGLPSLDVIRLFDKRSGVLLGNITIPNPQRLAFAPNGDLWAVSNNSVVRISSVGALNSIATTLPNLSSPISVAVDPTTSNVLVVDGGSSQQVKTYSQSGQLISTYGDLGGYTDCSPTVTSSRLFLDETAGVGYVGSTTGLPSAFITVLPDSSFWVGDPGNARLLHISSTGTYIEQISFLRWLYQVAADHNNPTRVFADDLEYSVDYTQPLVPGDPDPSLGGNGSWKLVRNWWACLPLNYANAIDQVQTFPNGHTYALISNSNDDSYDELAELPASGPILFSGRIMGYTGPFLSRVQPYFTHGGNLGSWLLDSAALNQLAVEQDLIDSDASEWPMWGFQNVIASSPWGPYTDPQGWAGWGMFMWPEATSNGEVVTYNTSPSTPGEDHHIGGIMLGGTNWSWKASPGALITTPDGQGTFPDYQSFGGHNGIAAMVEGSNIIQGYDGQNGSFSSQWMHWNQDGLLIGQFGHPYGLNPEGGMSAGAAGNIEKMSTVSANGNVYLYNSDENLHPGIHQWTISNLGSIHELTGSASVGGTIILSN